MSISVLTHNSLLAIFPHLQCRASSVQRRNFIKNIFSRLLTILAGIIFFYPILSYLFYRKTKVTTVIFRPSECLAEINFKRGIYLIKRERDLYALSAHCSHLGCIVNFDQKTHQFHCPCHGSIFDIQGKRLAGPARRPLSNLPVKFEKNGNVLVKVEE